MLACIGTCPGDVDSATNARLRAVRSVCPVSSTFVSGKNVTLHWARFGRPRVAPDTIWGGGLL